MSQEFLYGADVVARFQEVSGETMPKGMASSRSGDPYLPNRMGHGLLETTWIKMMTTSLARAWIACASFRREEILPTQGPGRGRIFAR